MKPNKGKGKAKALLHPSSTLEPFSTINITPPSPFIRPTPSTTHGGLVIHAPLNPSAHPRLPHSAPDARDAHAPGPVHRHPHATLSYGGCSAACSQRPGVCVASSSRTVVVLTPPAAPFATASPAVPGFVLAIRALSQQQRHAVSPTGRPALPSPVRARPDAEATPRSVPAWEARKGFVPALVGVREVDDAENDSGNSGDGGDGGGGSESDDEAQKDERGGKDGVRKKVRRRLKALESLMERGIWKRRQAVQEWDST